MNEPKDEDSASKRVILSGPTNFSSWRRNFQGIAIINGVWSLFTGQEAELTDTKMEWLGSPDVSEALAAKHRLDLEEYRSQITRKSTALGLLKCHVDPSIRPHLENYENPKEALDYLTKTFKMSDWRAYDLAMGKIDSLKFSDCEGCSDFKLQLEQIRLELADAGGNYTDRQLMSKIIRSLPPKFNRFIEAYYWTQEHGSSNPPVTLSQLHTHLLTFECLLKEEVKSEGKSESEGEVKTRQSSDSQEGPSRKRKRISNSTCDSSTFELTDQFGDYEREDPVLTSELNQAEIESHQEVESHQENLPGYQHTYIEGEEEIFCL